MYISIDLEDSYDDNFFNVYIYRHHSDKRGEYIFTIARLSTIPKYQALAMQNALKAANPENYPKCTLTVLSGGKEASI